MGGPAASARIGSGIALHVGTTAGGGGGVPGPAHSGPLPLLCWDWKEIGVKAWPDSGLLWAELGPRSQTEPSWTVPVTPDGPCGCPRVLREGAFEGR